jgi:hypothetical protein
MASKLSISYLLKRTSGMDRLILSFCGEILGIKSLNL